jgi:hypothetical protein
MSESNPRIVFSERLSTGIVVHFEKNVSVFYSAAFLYEQRDAHSNAVYSEDEVCVHLQDSEAVEDSEAVDDVPYWKVVLKMIASRAGN